VYASQIKPQIFTCPCRLYSCIACFISFIDEATAPDLTAGATDSRDSSTPQYNSQFLASVPDNKSMDVGVDVDDHDHDDADGDDLHVYKMDSNPRGLAIIINNKNIFGKKRRDGAEQDAKALQGLFEYLGFTVQLYNDLIAAQMEYVLKQVASSNHKAYNCLLVAILTHGEKMEKVYGIDKTVSLTHLINLFDGSNCTTLIGKPKIFFVQACRGDEKDTGVDAVDGPSIDETDSGRFLNRFYKLKATIKL